MDMATPSLSIAGLRTELAISLEAMAAAIGVSSKGRMSEIERGIRRPTAEQALALETLSGGRIDAAALHPMIQRARATPGTTATPAPGWQLSEAELATLPGGAREIETRVILCDLCEARLDGLRSCMAVDCPHADRWAA